MIGKVCRRGGDTRRLLGYLFTEGLAGERGLDSEHRDARVIAGYQDRAGLEPARSASGRAEVSRLAALLDAPVRAAGLGKDSKATYHLALSAAPTDRPLSDDEWGRIAAHFLDRLGLAERGDDEAIRWVAVRHADNHVHVVATLVRQDGRRVFPHHDFYRAREASLEVEAAYGLRATSPVERTAVAGTTRGELRKHAERSRARTAAGVPAAVGPDREVLRTRVRAALAGSTGWEDFTGRLQSSGVMLRERMSTRDPTQVTGYAVALPSGPGIAGGQALVWFGGGKLAPDLSLPQLQARWRRHTADEPGGVRTETAASTAWARSSDWTRGADPSGTGRNAMWAAADHALRAAQQQVDAACRPGASTETVAGGQAAAAAAGEVFTATAHLVERKRGGPLHAAAAHFDRAARDVHRRTVPATARSTAVRTAAGRLSGARIVQRAETRQLLALLGHLTRLSQTLAVLRDTQGRAAQAHAARQAAEQLMAETVRQSPTEKPTAASSYATPGPTAVVNRVAPSTTVTSPRRASR